MDEFATGLKPGGTINKDKIGRVLGRFLNRRFKKGYGFTSNIAEQEKIRKKMNEKIAELNKMKITTENERRTYRTKVRSIISHLIVQRGGKKTQE